MLVFNENSKCADRGRTTYPQVRLILSKYSDKIGKIYVGINIKPIGIGKRDQVASYFEQALYLRNFFAIQVTRQIGTVMRIKKQSEQEVEAI